MDGMISLYIYKLSRICNNVRDNFLQRMQKIMIKSMVLNNVIPPSIPSAKGKHDKCNKPCLTNNLTHDKFEKCKK